MTTYYRIFLYGFLAGMVLIGIFMSSMNKTHLYYSTGSRDEESVILDKIQSVPDSEKFECDFPPLTDLEEFFGYRNSAKAHCDIVRNFGGDYRGDGSKMVCLDKEFQMKPGNCVVLSFGINNEWSFDDAMDQYGCTVYAFDPTMGVASFNKTENIHFYDIGLSNFKEIIKIRKKDCKVDRYENILKMLGLLETEIDYLKIDIEGSEIEFFEDVLETNPNILKKVKQIGMEIHPSNYIPKSRTELKRSRFHHLWVGMHSLECLGFKLLSFELNNVYVNHYKWKNRKESTCYETVWIRQSNG